MTTTRRKTKKMAKVETQFGRELGEMIPAMVNELGFSEAAVAMGVTKSTLGYWMLKLGITTRGVALKPGETMEVVKRRS